MVRLRLDPLSVHSLVLETQFRFTTKVDDWGFEQIATFEELQSYTKEVEGVRDALEFAVTIEEGTEPEEDAADSSCDESKQETGYVGLKNQGATCYMNSLLQTLFHIGAFRQAVYSLPTDDDLSAQKAPICLALQRLFFNLEFGSRSVKTLELTQSFGWEDSESFTQHDVQELNRVLCDNLEEKMKASGTGNIIGDLFKGVSLSFINCTELDFKSQRKEEFYGS